MKRFFLIVLLAGVVLCSCAIMNPVVPLPNNILIVSPDPGLPPEIMAFSGKWGGRWWSPSCDRSHGLNAVLIIEKIIDERQATIVYGWGDSFEWNITKGWSRSTVNFSRNKEGKLTLLWTRRTGTKFEFRVKGDELEGMAGANTYITMERIQ